MKSHAPGKRSAQAIFNALDMSPSTDEDAAGDESPSLKPRNLAKRIRFIQHHLELGAPPNARNPYGHTYIQDLFLQNSDIPYKKFHFLLELFLKAGTDPNLRDDDGDTALQLLFGDSLRVTKKYTGPQIVSLAELLLKFKADPNIKDNEGETVYSKERYILRKIDWKKVKNLFLSATYPQAETWTEKQRASRMQSLFLAHHCGLNLKHLTPDPTQPDPEHWFDKYKELNTIYNQDGKIIGHRTETDAASHAKDMLSAMTKSFLIAPLIDRYPKLIPTLSEAYTKEEDENEDEYGNEDVESLRRGKRAIIHDSLSYALGKVLFAPRFKTNTPGVALPKILEIANRWDRNRAEIDKNLPSLSLSWDPLTPAAQAPNGLWLVPLTTEEALKEEGNTLQHCVAGYKKECALDNFHVIGIRYQPDQPAYTAGISLKSGKLLFTQNPLGYKNAEPPQDIIDAFEWYKDNLQNDTWGDMKEKSIFFAHRANARRKKMDTLTVDIGYNPRGKEGMITARQCWLAWTQNTDDLLRYRKFDLDTMLESSGLMTDFAKIAYRAGVVKTIPVR